MENTIEKITQYTKELRLPGIRKQFVSLAEDYGGEKQNYLSFLNQLLEVEHTTRLHNRRISRISEVTRCNKLNHKLCKH